MVFILKVNYFLRQHYHFGRKLHTKFLTIINLENNTRPRKVKGIGLLFERLVNIMQIFESHTPTIIKQI